jgi:hypothetical protein
MRILLLLLIISSCAGYSFKEKNNPFNQFGIESISVPMFYNHTNFPGLSGAFTKKIFHTLSDFKELMIYSGLKSTDAVLIGIIESPDKKRETVITDGRNKVQNTYGEDVIGQNRSDFLLPTKNKLNLRLRLIVIKHPSSEEIKFFQTKIGEKALSSKVIFNEVVDLKTSYTLSELDQSAISVLGSQNRGIQKEALRGLADTAANSFKDMILYAF